MDDERYERGMRTRRAVLGDEHVDRAEATKSELDEYFQRFITETAWASVWARTELDRSTRSLVTIALLAAQGRSEELAMHLRATRNTGATKEEVAETLLHVAVYAGVPAALSAFTLARSIFDEEGFDHPEGEASDG